jgi:Domain of unknown function (DUF4276)
VASKLDWGQAMKRIFVVVEGETEERFLRSVLYDHFILRDIHLEGQQWITNRKLGTKGGGKNFDFIQNHVSRLVSHYKSDPEVFISTMIDLYAFPRQGKTVYDQEVEKIRSGKGKALLLQEKLAQRVNYRNFIPYVQLHEFEALLLARPDSLAHFYANRQNEIEALKLDIAGIAPEEINDTSENAPSKRIIRHIPSYEKQKTTAGVITAAQIGLPLLRQTCPHFAGWITKLECI